MNQLTDNPTLKETVGTDTELKEWLVNYVGQNLDPDNENGEVTVEMIVETVSKEFPEFLLAVAEENWVRGYYQAMVDVEQGTKAIREAVHNRGRPQQTDNTGTDTTGESKSQ
jgi:hypothetical protein